MKITRNINGYTYTTELTPNEIAMAYAFHKQKLDRDYIDQYLQDINMFVNMDDEQYYRTVENIREEMSRLIDKYSMPQSEAITLAVAIVRQTTFKP